MDIKRQSEETDETKNADQSTTEQGTYQRKNSLVEEEYQPTMSTKGNVGGGLLLSRSEYEIPESYCSQIASDSLDLLYSGNKKE